MQKAVDAVWVVVGCAVAVLSAKLGLWKGNAPGAGFFPFASAIFMTIGGALALSGGRSEPRIEWPDAPQALVIVATFAGAFFIVAIASNFGFLVACIIGAPILILAMHSKNWLRSTLVGIAFGASVYFFFAYVLQLPLPRGVWGL